MSKQRGQRKGRVLSNILITYNNTYWKSGKGSIISPILYVHIVYIQLLIYDVVHAARIQLLSYILIIWKLRYTSHFYVQTWIVVCLTEVWNILAPDIFIKIEQDVLTVIDILQQKLIIWCKNYYLQLLRFLIIV